MPNLPADTHVHSEWSWDARNGSMERTCARAVELGVPAVAFTEHVDLTSWTVQADAELLAGWEPFVVGNVMTPPELDVGGYLETLQRCRVQFPSLDILAGIEFSEPHRHPAAFARFSAAGWVDRVVSSVHAVPVADDNVEISGLFAQRPPTEVVRDYLSEIQRMIESSDVAVLGHIDYAARYWPLTADPYDPLDFADAYRSVLAALADKGGALEINTTIPLDPVIVAWWVEVGGSALTFGSDAHDPMRLGRGLEQAAQLSMSLGFHPGSRLSKPWTIG